MEFKNIMWFWGSYRLSISMSNIWILVWIFLPNFPLHFYYLNFFEYIGNDWGTYMKMDLENSIEILDTYSPLFWDRSYEVSSNIVILKWKHVKYIKESNYEKTTFQFLIYQLQGHLQSRCARTWAHPPTKKGRYQK